MSDVVHVIGASGRSGRALCRALAALGRPYVPVVRDRARWRATALPGDARIADLTDHFLLASALRDAATVVSCAHARHTRDILAAARDATRFVLLGSTRRYTRWLDAHGTGVLSGETALLGSGRPGVMLHPTMIYGAQGENNVQRLARMIRRLPFVPLPGGGKALVQPIHQTDLTRCILAAIDVQWNEPRTIVVAGADAVTYADFVRAVANAAGLPSPRIVRVPGALLIAVAPLTQILPFVPAIQTGEVRRLLEDKAFPVGPMFSLLGVRPMPLEDGLRLTFETASPSV